MIYSPRFTPSGAFDFADVDGERVVSRAGAFADDMDWTCVESTGFYVSAYPWLNSGQGTVYIDDIRLYPCRPGALATDLNGDCVVDARDLALLANTWLNKKLRP